MTTHSLINNSPITLHPVSQTLRAIMTEKKTCLALSADVTSGSQLLNLAESLGSEICVLKTHIDILTDFTPGLIKNLKELAKAHRFLIFEDRKFADIGHTVKRQYEQGIYHIAEWADIINAHAIPGPGIIQGLAAAGCHTNKALLLIANMSSKGNLFTAEYMQNTLRMAEDYPETVMGFISQHRLSANQNWIHFTPGIQFSNKSDQLGQNYLTPEDAIITHQTDIIIVGRGILDAPDPFEAASAYRKAAWSAYLQKSIS